ncbi:hypothetical protein LV716_07470 [Flagellimonas sp. HMM57]|uniref:hypothetical protein n=1 Tax=unclassified Flagellimonas TaxID=2644544 RepID=UPI0013D13CA2|nr:MULTISPECIES: hypothetical protein [unclassified Flagellimonas]UII77599.1 hypothetical protein LV716_07470 [Flagellimonas sp. HMM57]
MAKYQMQDRREVNLIELRLFMKSAATTPFWNNKFKTYKVDFNATDLLSEIHKLPILTKKEVKANIKTICNYNAPGKISMLKTSGTTGSGMIFPQTQSMENHQWAVWWRYRTENGINLNTRCAWFGGRSILSPKKNTPPYWHHSTFLKQVMFSAHHLNSETVSDYYDCLKKKNLEWLHGYPSQIALLANLIEKKGLEPLVKVRIISFGSENLMENQIIQIRRTFKKARLIQHYGLAEGVANISQTNKDKLVPDQDFAYTEFIKDQDSGPYMVLGTNYHNLAFPLIRYNTGDNISMEKQPFNETQCILEVNGRNEDYLILPNGTKLGRLDHIFKSFTNIDEAQIHQVSKEEIIVKIVKGSGFSLKEEKRLINEFRKRVGDEIFLKFEYLEAIPRTASGKLKFVVTDV